MNLPFKKYIYLFWLCWLFVATYGLSLLATSQGYSSCGASASHCGGFSRCRAWALGHIGSGVVHEFSCSTAGGIFLNQGPNQCTLHWQKVNLPFWFMNNYRGSFYILGVYLLLIFFEIKFMGKQLSSFFTRHHLMFCLCPAPLPLRIFGWMYSKIVMQ